MTKFPGCIREYSFELGVNLIVDLEESSDFARVFLSAIRSTMSLFSLNSSAW